MLMGLILNMVVIFTIPDKRWATKINWMMCSVPHCRDVEEAEAAACLEGMLPQLVTISIWTFKWRKEILLYGCVCVIKIITLSFV